MIVCLFVWAGLLGSDLHRANGQVADADRGPATKQTKELRQHDADSVEQGYRIILEKRFLPPDFHQTTFDQIWKIWPEKLRAQAERAAPDTRRKMAYQRYGLTARSRDDLKPLQFVVDPTGNWSLNCFACHGGALYDGVLDSVVPAQAFEEKTSGSSTTEFSRSFRGLPNNRIALETLYEDMRKIKTKLGIAYSGMDIGSSLIPMGKTVGTSNAVIFGVSLMSFRDRDLELKSLVIPPLVVHHDMDAPPWWNYARKKMLYIDGFTARHHRALMPFIMVRQNDGKKFRGFESDFKKIQRFIESSKPPRFPFKLDHERVQRGKIVFNNRCAQCHGTYDAQPEYPERRVDIEEIGTDPVRLRALSQTYRNRYRESWLADYGKVKTLDDPGGYIAPPLNGIWATAPYLHNGSLPSLMDVLDSRNRPQVWKRLETGFDKERVGIAVEKLDRRPTKLPSDQRRLYFDTTRFGKSNVGHEFGDDLTPQQRIDVVEYLKTL